MTRQLPVALDVLAPDGSEIRELARSARGSMAHGTLPVGGVSLAIRHRTVEELWFILSGTGEVWRRLDDHEEKVSVQAGTSLSIPVGTAFQFRNTGATPFTFLMCTMPAWPGPDEAERVNGAWDMSDEC